LVSFATEVDEEVADLLLAGVDDVTGRGLVDGIGDAATEFLEAAAQALQEGVGGNGGKGSIGVPGAGGKGNESQDLRSA
jgi:hypothetical protein